MTARATHPLSSYSLDLEGLTVSAVSVDGHPASYRREGTKLLVTPPRAARGTFTTRVRYAGRPVTHIDADAPSAGRVPTNDGATVVSEPVGAMTWLSTTGRPALS